MLDLSIGKQVYWSERFGYATGYIVNFDSETAVAVKTYSMQMSRCNETVFLKREFVRDTTEKAMQDYRSGTFATLDH